VNRGIILAEVLERPSEEGSVKVLESRYAGRREFQIGKLII